MMRYGFVRDSHRVCTLRVGPLPMVVTGDASIPHHSLSIAMAMLLDYFKGEDQAEVKARLLARPIGRALNRLGDQWELSEEELHAMVLSAHSVIAQEGEDFIADESGSKT